MPFWGHGYDQGRKNCKGYPKCMLLQAPLPPKCYSPLVRSADHSGEFTDPVWKRYEEWLRRWWLKKNQPIRNQHLAENHEHDGTLIRSESQVNWQFQHESNMMSGCGDNVWKRDQSEACKRQKITGAWRYTSVFCVPPIRSYVSSMKLICPIVLEKSGKPKKCTGHTLKEGQGKNSVPLWCPTQIFPYICLHGNTVGLQ